MTQLAQILWIKLKMIENYRVCYIATAGYMILTKGEKRYDMTHAFIVCIDIDVYCSTTQLPAEPSLVAESVLRNMPSKSEYV